MARREGYQGQLIIDHLKDLKKGDKVYVTYWGDQYVPVEVTRVRTVECATIVTIKKVNGVPTARFVGYHTKREAQGDHQCVLTIERYSATNLENSLERADKKSDKLASRANALEAMRMLRKWLLEDDAERI